ncbi:MAG: hypothetical protein JNM12_15055 [Alphaproteobacteria bacterium]|nr:hypothetical protein [Alphaproteobacteria bacterium]
MKKRINISGVIERKEYGGEPSFVFFLPNESIRNWCLGLALLKEDLVENIVFVPNEGELSFILRLDTEAPSGAIKGAIENDAICVVLSDVTLDYLLSFSLKHYRDGYAEVDHIDLQTDFENLGNNIYVTLKFDTSGPPVGGE